MINRPKQKANGITLKRKNFGY